GDPGSARPRPDRHGRNAAPDALNLEYTSCMGTAAATPAAVLHRLERASASAAEQRRPRRTDALLLSRVLLGDARECCPECRGQTTPDGQSEPAARRAAGWRKWSG